MCKASVDRAADRITQLHDLVDEVCHALDNMTDKRQKEIEVLRAVVKDKQRAADEMKAAQEKYFVETKESTEQVQARLSKAIAQLPTGEQLADVNDQLNKLDREENLVLLLGTLYQALHDLTDLSAGFRSFALVIALGANVFQSSSRFATPTEANGAPALLSDFEQEVALKHAVRSAELQSLICRVALNYSKVYRAHVADGMKILSTIDLLPGVADIHDSLVADAEKLSAWCEQAQRGTVTTLQAELDVINAETVGDQTDQLNQALAKIDAIRGARAPEIRTAVEHASDTRTKNQTAMSVI
ncbi:hypothetical protein PUNSTDRAFT_127390 [Punctularia strigosozonata HHB-11173 SS5]|uniref:uncharacterized protein n=1 Tax=Punctularia strigosozonata (strain HHB-11173) TaxID=741275 RepID=UPI0004416784|nr:uncharacterized protein PUNSTDRAFT_127390 [Punctularia strigosozonata HHB-11173 SS5]EIN06757.1 hypothetical protein PUNSTDRAFT_127390 [Punctularia strigosozonata HHB-11173 SS5]